MFGEILPVGAMPCLQCHAGASRLESLRGSLFQVDPFWRCFALK
jgi:hypothetical protein